MLGLRQDIKGLVVTFVCFGKRVSAQASLLG